VCDWLNSIGVTGILLKYRVPVRAGQERYAAPLQDVQRTIRLTRAHADEWHVDPQRIGVLGFSAGGHLAAAASTMADKRTYDPIDAADQLNCRPNFSVLIYPAYLTPEKSDDTLSPELTVDKETPPTFLIMTEDDPIRVENVLVYTRALKKSGVAAELHVYPTGGHGYGLRPTELPVTHWPALAASWIYYAWSGLPPAARGDVSPAGAIGRLLIPFYSSDLPWGLRGARPGPPAGIAVALFMQRF
jgi:acetyl esterase/lipase